MNPITWLEGIFRVGVDAFYGWTTSYGFAIIILTVLVRVAILPLTLYQMKSMKKMQELQPLVKQLQEKYKGKPEQLNKEMVELYRTYKVNPVTGCLPMVVQIPFLWAIFNVLRDYSFDPAAGKFLGLWALDVPDPLYLLPVLTGATMFWQSYISGQGNDPTQRTMMYVMPVVFGWFTVSFPAGVALYWVVSTLFGIGQQYIYPGVGKAKGEAASK